jgi:DNA-binding NarL/FixJ family response regulator
MKKTKIILVEDHGVLRETLVIALNMEDDFEIIGHWNCAEDALEFLAHNRSELAIVDYMLPGMDGIQFTRKAKKLQPNIKIIMLSMYTDRDSVLRAFDAGAIGFIPKHVSIRELITAVKMVEKGEPTLPRKMTAEFINYVGELKKAPPVITNELRNILRMAADGYSNSEISIKTGQPVPRIKYQFRQIFEILDARDRTHCVVRALKRGFLTLDEVDREGISATMPLTLPVPEDNSDINAQKEQKKKAETEV